jgi:homoaconitase/3-isopropylmalate dehydratase large subunit
MYDKLFDDHVISSTEDGTALIYIDRHLVVGFTLTFEYRYALSYSLFFYFFLS